MNVEQGEQSSEAKFESFHQELDAFNDQTNNYISIIIGRFQNYLEHIPDDPFPQAIKMALDEKGIIEEDREQFSEIWRGRVDINAENYSFAADFLRKIKEIYRELLDGKYGTKFTRKDLNG